MLFVDIDNTLANTNAELINLGIDISVYPSSIPASFWGDGFLFQKAKPIPTTIQLVKYLSQYFPLVYITARDTKYGMITLKWLSEQKMLPFGVLVFSNGKPKGEIIKGFDCSVIHLIEDSPEEIESVLSLKRKTHLYIPDWPYNRHIQGTRIKIL